MAKRDSRALILLAARAEFAECGLGRARVDRIARRARVNKQLIFYYFKSKVGLYQATLDAAADEVASQEVVDGAAPFRETIVAIFDQLCRQPEALALTLRGVHDPVQGEPSLGRVLPQARQRIRDVISTGQGVGLVRDDADPEVLALQVIVLLIGFLALEPAVARLPGAISRDRWAAAIGETFARTLAW